MAIIATSSPPITKMVHVKHRALRKCCFCIHLRAGVALSCAVWAGLGIYFAALAFQNESPFYSYLQPTALTVSGVINLAMALVGFFGIFASWVNYTLIIRNLSHFIWTMILILLTDNLVNIIVFGMGRADYRAWCSSASQSAMNEQVQAAFPNGTSIALAFNTNNDFYNCDKLWIDELKLAILAYIFMFLIYFYWAATIWSYSHKRAIIEANLQKAAAQAAAAAAAGAVANPISGPGVAPPPPAMMPIPPSNGLPMNPGGLPMQMPLGRPGAGRGNIIVLNNEKPSRNSTPPIQSNSTPPIQSNSTPPILSSSPDGARHDSGYSRDVKKPLFGFKIGYDGGVSELDQRDVDVELGLAAAEAERQHRYETDSGVEDMSGMGEYLDSRSSTPRSKRTSRNLTRKPVSPLPGSSDEHYKYNDYGYSDYGRHSRQKLRMNEDTEDVGLR